MCQPPTPTCASSEYAGTTSLRWVAFQQAELLRRTKAFTLVMVHVKEESSVRNLASRTRPLPSVLCVSQQRSQKQIFETLLGASTGHQQGLQMRLSTS